VLVLKSSNDLDDLGVPPFYETSIWRYNWDIVNFRIQGNQLIIQKSGLGYSSTNGAWKKSGTSWELLGNYETLLHGVIVT